MKPYEIKVFSIDGILRFNLFIENIVIGKCDVLKQPNKNIFIEELFIHANFRNKGYGSILFKHVLTIYSSYNIILMPHPYVNGGMSKTNLIKFYKKLGFKPYNNYQMIKINEL